MGYGHMEPTCVQINDKDKHLNAVAFLRLNNVMKDENTKDK